MFILFQAMKTFLMGLVLQLYAGIYQYAGKIKWNKY